MQPHNYSFLQMIRIGFLAGLAYALLFGLPLYICCAFWFSLVFPQQNYAIGLSLLLAFATVLQIGIALVFWGYWRLGAMLIKKTGSMAVVILTSTWMALVILFLLWQVSQVSNSLAVPFVPHPGNPINRFILVYFLTLCFIPLGCFPLSAFGAGAVTNKAKQGNLS